jgi:predicted GNAT superfamily acetyltransferase
MACYPRQIGEADAFHTRLRFVKVGAAVLLGGAKTVRDLEQALSRD